jgi:lipopolysaccharide/colanic/teichoic acid biosynthesis glycosyltransferase
MWIGKRVFDLFFSTLGLIVLSPIFLLIAVLIKLDSPGPIFFRQKRVGLNEVPFFIHKFRTMYVDAEARGLKITVGADPRITKIGAFIRKYKIDELPQLIDVFLGTMSLVGPRPEVPIYVEKYPLELRKKIFSMRPGITDWASIEYKDENAILARASDPESAYIKEVLPEKLRYYEKYFNHASLLTDFKIIMATLMAILVKR